MRLYGSCEGGAALRVWNRGGVHVGLDLYRGVGMGNMSNRVKSGLGGADFLPAESGSAREIGDAADMRARRGSG